MKKNIILGIFAVAVLLLSSCNNHTGQNQPKGLVIERQGVFSSGGRVTDPIPGEYDATQNWMDQSRKGTTTHVDHANTFYQIPACGNGIPVVFLHGYGQTRIGWQATPDGRKGWADLFLKKGYSVFLVDQPRRGAASATEMIVDDPGDVDGPRYKVGEQAWYTHFRIGRVAPERYEGSQFPAGDEAQNQFFCQMTPNSGNYDEPLFGQVLSDVMADVNKMTGKKAVYITHSQGGRVGWQTDTENGPEDIQSTGFWQMVLNQCRDFAEHYNADGGNATVVYLPNEGIKGNSHFMFQEMNNGEIADFIMAWLEKNNIK